MLDNQSLLESKDVGTLAQAIVDTVREPLLVLDKDLCVLAASRSFYLTFKVTRTETEGKLLYALGDGQWDIPGLRLLLEKVVPEHGVMEDYESGLGTSIVNALAQQLEARVDVVNGPHGTTVSVAHATFAKMNQATPKDDLIQRSTLGHD